MTKVPNLFIVGAPKCGTTFLYTYLKKHPDIYFPNFKEPHFFGSDLIRKNGAYDLSQKDYNDLFSTNKKIIGEASTFYIFSKKSAQEIYNHNPKAKIIIMIRNLVDLVHSLHAQFIFSGDEIVEDFSKALDLEKSRLNGKNIPKQTTIVNKLYYTTNILSIPNNIESYINLFGIENIRFIHLDEIKNNPRKVYKDTLDFLNVDSGFRIDTFKVVNKNKVYKYRIIRDLLKKYSILLGKLRSVIIKKPLGIVKFFEKLNLKEQKRLDISKDLYEKLTNKLSKTEIEINDIINRR
ncbi:MAG: hypothetical protein CMG54_02425 [Candidatus Marinimicrobia bacterium]|nr:hypothetical protein [Candidatus Neomarinimicrobiota bacterium]|tara:strand:- start:73 stop:951 length:879 start_codon:yes stop_codon:yes gene_type:complete